MVKPCSVEGCEQRAAARGWCRKHYYRWKRHGDPLGLAPPRPVTQTAEDRARYARKHYDANRASYVDRAREFRQRRRAELRAIAAAAKSRPCADCRVQFSWWVMQFDHVGDDKAANVADLCARAVPVATLLAEIAKCDVVCANCHADRTYRRRIADSGVEQFGSSAAS